MPGNGIDQPARDLRVIALGGRKVGAGRQDQPGLRRQQAVGDGLMEIFDHPIADIVREFVPKEHLHPSLQNERPNL
jgi:hypothetical protein